MSKFSNFLGIDVSKEFFDAVVILNNDKSNVIHSQFQNNDKGLKRLCSWLKDHEATASNTGEHTYSGTNIYNGYFRKNP